MNDLISKEEMLAMFDQKTMVYGNLTFLEDNYNARLPASMTRQIASMG